MAVRWAELVPTCCEALMVRLLSALSEGLAEALTVAVAAAHVADAICVALAYGEGVPRGSDRVGVGRELALKPLAVKIQESVDMTLVRPEALSTPEGIPAAVLEGEGVLNCRVGVSGKDCVGAAELLLQPVTLLEAARKEGESERV